MFRRWLAAAPFLLIASTAVAEDKVVDQNAEPLIGLFLFEHGRVTTRRWDARVNAR